MEKSLLDKLHNGTMDEIDEDMIAARVKNAVSKIMEECSNSVDRIDALFKEYSEETKIAGVSCVVLAQCKIFHRNDGESDVSLIIGSTPRIEAMIEHEKGDLNR